MRISQSLELTQIILVAPLEADLEVVVLSDHSKEFIEEVGALALGKTVNVLHMVTNGKDCLPAGYWVGADNWVYSGKLVADIEWRATLLSVQLEIVVLSCLCEKRLSVGSSQTLQELLVSWREAVVNLIAGGPKGV